MLTDQRKLEIATAIVRSLLRRRILSSGLESLSGKRLVEMAEDTGVTTGELCDFLEPIVRSTTADLLDAAFFVK
jgi:hypothetical protein